MKAKDFRFIEWLYLQIPDLEKEKVIDAETGSRLRSRYGELPVVERGRAAMTVFAVLGSVLVGLGAILACAPLTASIGFGAFVLSRKMRRVARRESASVLIGQTYQIQGGLGVIVLAFLLSYGWPWRDIG